jgi:hypothetical protein
VDEEVLNNAKNNDLVSLMKIGEVYCKASNPTRAIECLCLLLALALIELEQSK